MTMSLGSLISFLALHLTQYPSLAAILELLSVRALCAQLHGPSSSGDMPPSTTPKSCSCLSLLFLHPSSIGFLPRRARYPPHTDEQRRRDEPRQRPPRESRGGPEPLREQADQHRVRGERPGAGLEEQTVET